MQCDCGRPWPAVPYDAAAAFGLSSDDVRARWPRLDHLCECGRRSIVYHSFEHFLMGDW